MEQLHLVMLDDEDALGKKIRDTLSPDARLMIVGTTKACTHMVRGAHDNGEGLLLVDKAMPAEMVANVQTSADALVMSLYSGEEAVHHAPDSSILYYAVLPIPYQEVLAWHAGSAADGANAQGEKNAERLLSTLFLKIGLPGHIQGHRYIMHAVCVALQKPEAMHRITKGLYEEVAVHFGSSVSKVERSIRHAIDYIWTNGRIEALNEHFGFVMCDSDRRMTNGEYISLLVECCKR